MTLARPEPMTPANLMAEGMRWFGPSDPVTLPQIRQAGARAVFTSLHQIAYGEAWPFEAIVERRDEVAAAGLTWTIVESVPVSEAIKTRTGPYAQHIENYAASLRALGRAGVNAVVYNFMPVLDWMRTDLRFKLDDGSEALLYDPAKLAAFDLFGLKRSGAEADFSPEVITRAKKFWASLDEAGRSALIAQTLDLFPGVKMNLSLEGFRAQLQRYSGISREKLQEHLRLFLRAVAPIAEDAGVRLALHPDDPPFSILGLPRIVSTEDDLQRALDMVDLPANGICYCTGSLSARADNDLAGIVQRLGARINAVHLRSVERQPNGVFFEADHLAGSVDMPAVVQALLAEQAARLRSGRADWQVTLRPDHGHTMLDDLTKPPPACPGYSLIGRLRGLAELRGLQTGLSYARELRSPGL